MHCEPKMSLDSTISIGSSISDLDPDLQSQYIIQGKAPLIDRVRICAVRRSGSLSPTWIGRENHTVPCIDFPKGNMATRYLMLFYHEFDLTPRDPLSPASLYSQEPNVPNYERIGLYC